MDPVCEKELQRLEREAWRSAQGVGGTGVGSAETLYEKFRAHAARMNEAEGWMSAELFEATLPTVPQQYLIDELDNRIGASSQEPGEAAERLLRQLAGWARGVRAAGQTLR